MECIITVLIDCVGMRQTARPCFCNCGYTGCFRNTFTDSSFQNKGGGIHIHTCLKYGPVHSLYARPTSFLSDTIIIGITANVGPKPASLLQPIQFCLCLLPSPKSDSDLSVIFLHIFQVLLCLLVGLLLCNISSICLL